MKKYMCLLCLTMAVLLTACQHQQTTSEGQQIDLKYAQNIVLSEGNGFVEATLRNPWDTTAVLQTYILVPREQELPANLPQGVVVRTPVNKALVETSVHCALLMELGVGQAIAGVCDSEYLKAPELTKGLQQGSIADCGNSMNPNIEAVIQLKPDAILLSPFQNSGDYGKLGKLGIPIIQCADYMEVGPLARAEWVRFYGLLFGCADKATEQFNTTEQHYLQLKEQAKNCTQHPKILSDTRYNQQWYVPAGKSTVSMLYEDAGAQNPFSYIEQSGSAALSPEQVLDKAHDAEIWLLKYNQATEMTLEQLKGEADIYSQFKAFQDGNVWGCNTGVVNFYEEEPFHPEYWLEDLMRICHPELNLPGENHYYTKLK